MSLSREQIFAARALRKPEPLEVPEWGGTVFIKYLTVEEQLEISKHNQPAEMPVAVLLAALVDEDEKPIFGPEDFGELAKEAFTVILRVFAVAAKQNGLSNAELEEAMENFGTTLSAPPPTDLGSRSATFEGGEISQAGS